MASMQDFVAKLSKVQGVKSYSVFRRDGRILSHNVRLADRVAAMIVLCGLSAESVMAAAGLSGLRCLVFARGKQERLLVFPTKQFFLLVIEAPGAYTLDLLRDIEGIIGSSMPA
jgi:predicted regulator of Ras-like GTPase activity (Roadblock/LC7/MglB family)